MGLLDFDISKVTDNPSFMLGMNIMKNNQGHYGNTGAALGYGLQDYQRQRMLMTQNQLQQQKQKWLQEQFKQQQAQYQNQQANQQKQKEWMTSNMPQYAGAPSMVQRAAVKQKYSALPKPTAFDQKLGLYKNDKKTFDAMYPNKPLVNVSNNLRTVNEQIELDDRLAQAKNARGYVSNVIETGINSNQMLGNTDTMIDLINSGASTGFGEDYVIKTKQILSQFGIKYPELANQEQLQTLMGDLVMGRVQQTKGAVSEMEMKLFKEYSANVGKTEKGNLAILDFNRQKLLRNDAMSKIATGLQSKGVRASEIRAELLKYRDANPISRYTQTEPNKYNFSDQEESEYQMWKSQRLSR